MSLFENITAICPSRKRFEKFLHRKYFPEVYFFSSLYAAQYLPKFGSATDKSFPKTIFLRKSIFLLGSHHESTTCAFKKIIIKKSFEHLIP